MCMSKTHILAPILGTCYQISPYFIFMINLTQYLVSFYQFNPNVKFSIILSYLDSILNESVNIIG